MMHEDDIGPINFTVSPYILRLLFYAIKPQRLLLKNKKLASVSSFCKSRSTSKFRRQILSMHSSCIIYIYDRPLTEINVMLASLS